MIIDGLLISVFGIGMVFTIFIILIILMNVTSAFVVFLDKKFPVSTAELKPSVSARNAGDTDENLVAIAITTALQNEKKKSALIKQ
jgi:sodium pump decarboxylase gamma subunit